ncbi:MAG: hypothetical protein CL912_29470 [Deltaproteobacteria bacterium]|nr:hypothetical protein [Deltaproteobacteria bacterium]
MAGNSRSLKLRSESSNSKILFLSALGTWELVLIISRYLSPRQDLKQLAKGMTSTLNTYSQRPASTSAQSHLYIPRKEWPGQVQQ